MLENQQVRIQWFTKIGDKLPERTSHQSPGKEANKLKLANNGYVRNHKLLGSQPNTKQKSRQVDVLGIDWSRKHKSISNQDAKTHEYHICSTTDLQEKQQQQRSNKKHMQCGLKAANRREDILPQESSSRTTIDIVS